VLADPDGGRLVIADSGHHRIAVADLDGRVLQIAGDGMAGLVDGGWDTARFRNPQGMALDPNGRTLFVADTSNHALRALELASGETRTVAGTGERAHSYEPGPGPETALASPWDLAWLDGKVWIAMAGTHQLWTYDPETAIVGPAAGTGHESIHDGPLASATFAQPSGLSALDGVLYVADSETSAVRKVDPADDRVKRLVGRGLFQFGDVDAAGDSVRLQHPLDVAATSENGRHAVYIADSYNDKIKRLDPESRAVTTVFGGVGHGLVDGVAETAEFWEPGGLSLAGGTLYVADTNNHAIRAVNLDTRTVRTLEMTQS
jgi:sugar lactone lactonase YvrE